jgi:hypothetical protein
MDFRFCNCYVLKLYTISDVYLFDVRILKLPRFEILSLCDATLSDDTFCDVHIVCCYVCSNTLDGVLDFS